MFRITLSALVSSLLWTLPASAAAPVVVAGVELTPIFDELRFSGSVTSPSAARLSVATAGLTTRVAVDAGDRVAAGDVLLELDDELARLAVRRAQAALAQARFTLQDAERRLRDLQALRDDNSVAESTVLSQRAEVQAQQALLQKLTVELATERAVLARHRLRAPFAGTISARAVEPGEWISPGARVLDLVATEGLRVDLAIPEDHLQAVRRLQQASVSPQSDPDTRIAASVAAVVPVADPVSRTFLLRLQLPAGAALVPGMAVTAELDIPAGREGIVVPRDALLRYPDGRTVVWVLRETQGEQRVLERLVQAGVSFDNRIEVRGELLPTDRVVVKGNESLSDGQRVTVEPSGR